MAYSQKIIDMVASSPKTPGNLLGRWAIHLDFPVTKIAYALGVTRQTVYNWFEGKDVFVAYQNRVDLLLSIMSTSATADEAWRRICKAYDLKP
jgi:plasmid maintenance system antidote protein VapI